MLEPASFSAATTVIVPNNRRQDARASGPPRLLDLKTRSLNSLGRMLKVDTQVPDGNPGQPHKNGRKIIYGHFPLARPVEGEQTGVVQQLPLLRLFLILRGGPAPLSPYMCHLSPPRALSHVQHSHRYVYMYMGHSCTHSFMSVQGHASQLLMHIPQVSTLGQSHVYCSVHT